MKNTDISHDGKGFLSRRPDVRVVSGAPQKQADCADGTEPACRAQDALVGAVSPNWKHNPVTTKDFAVPSSQSAMYTSPAGDREEPAFSRPPRDGRGPGQPGGRDGELVTPGTLPSDPKPALITAEVASHAGLSPMLLEASYRDVMQRRAGR